MRAAISLAALLSLVACSGEAAETDPAITAAATDIVAPAPAPLPPAPPPIPGPVAGSWVFTVTVQGDAKTPSRTLPPTRECFPFQLTMKQAQLLSAAPDAACTDYQSRQEGSATIGEFICDLPDGDRTQNQVTTTGDINRAYTSIFSQTIVKPGAPDVATRIIAAAREGDCPDAPPPPPLLPGPPAAATP